MNVNIVNIIAVEVETALDLPFTIYADLIPNEDDDGACLRHDPAPAADRRFSDGSRLIAWNLTFYIRCKNAASARTYAKNITDKLDGETITADGLKIECEASTLPQFIDTDAKQFTTYSAAIKCTYLEPAQE